jgi:hypothetical protein
MVHRERPGGAVDNPTAQRFILQMLVALFAEDIDMLPRYMVDRLLADCKTKQDSRDLIGGLFEAMNTREKTDDDRYQGVAYFNGGLFAEPARVELRLDELDLLRAASKEDWSKVRPEIFGTLFQHSLGAVERRAFGAHYHEDRRPDDRGAMAKAYRGSGHPEAPEPTLAANARFHRA